MKINGGRLNIRGIEIELISTSAAGARFKVLDDGTQVGTFVIFIGDRLELDLNFDIKEERVAKISW